MRIEQPEGTRGSLKWMQRLIDRHPVLLDQRLREAGGLDEERINWRSPLKDDQWAEYRDADFLNRLGLGSLADELKQFWPDRGPQWDALGRDSSGRIYLVEAKAHDREMISTCQAGHTSRDLISRSLNRCKQEFGVPIESDWLNGYYQYANRLAHLYFLQKQGVDARLVFLYFVGDCDMNGPLTQDEWSSCIQTATTWLGFKNPVKGVISVFQHVEEI